MTYSVIYIWERLALPQAKLFVQLIGDNMEIMLKQTQINHILICINIIVIIVKVRN